MSNERPSEKTVIDEVIENLITRTAILEKLLLEKNEALLIKERQTQVLLAAFDEKFNNIAIQAPKPDMSGITAELHSGLKSINNTLEKWPRPIKSEYRFALFPEQVRSVDYVRAVLTRVILCLLALVLMTFAYMLLNKHV